MFFALCQYMIYYIKILEMWKYNLKQLETFQHVYKTVREKAFFVDIVL